MTRYQALRYMNCDRLTAVVVTFFNWVRGVPAGEVRFLNVTVSYFSQEKT